MSRQKYFDWIVHSLNEAAFDKAHWQDTSALIDEALGSHGSLLTFGTEHTGGVIEIDFARCFFRGTDRSDLQRTYFRDYYPTDEHMPRLRTLPDSRIVHIRELFSGQERKASRTYNEWLPRCNFENSLNVRMDGPWGSRIVWAIADPVDANGWSSARLEMVANVLPHVRQYVRVYSALADAAALGSSINDLLDNTRMGIIQLDRRALILEANDCARQILRKKDGLSDCHRELCAAAPPDQLKLSKLLDQALAPFGKQKLSGSMVVMRPSLSPSFVLHVKPISRIRADDDSRNVAALVLIIDPVGRMKIDAGLVEAALGLSPKETEIAVLLTVGYTLRQIADIKHRGYSTVRTHLKNIFAKLRVSRQYDVVRMVRALSNLPGVGTRDSGSVNLEPDGLHQDPGGC